MVPGGSLSLFKVPGGFSLVAGAHVLVPLYIVS